jgi:tetratricopeptide (TPR) repeat protein
LTQIDEQQELNCLDIQGVLEKVWRNWFRMNLQADVPFEMGRICFGLGHYRPALRYYAYSHELVGESYITFYNMGIALYELGDLHGAERMLQRSLALNEYDRSIIWLAKTRKERQQRLLDGLSDYSCPPEAVEDLKAFVKTTLSRIL